MRADLGAAIGRAFDLQQKRRALNGGMKFHGDSRSTARHAELGYDDAADGVDEKDHRPLPPPSAQAQIAPNCALGH